MEREKLEYILEGEGYNKFEIADMIGEGIFNNIDPDESEDFESDVIDTAKEWYDINKILHNN